MLIYWLSREPFDGVVVPNLVRAVSTNGTGCLKLGSNYLLSVKAVQQAQEVVKSAHAALFLDDRPELPLHTRKITEWDSSCALFALKDGSLIKIPKAFDSTLSYHPRCLCFGSGTRRIQ